MSETESGNMLFSQPWVYERIYPEASNETIESSLGIFKRFALGRTLSILEIGCGTGRTLAGLAKYGHDIAGVDISRPMVDYVARLHPEMKIFHGDMRTFDLDRQFDAVICSGSTFTYNLTNEDVHKSLSNFRKHCKDGGLLVLGLLNASRFLGSETFNELVETQVNSEDFHATAFSRHLLDRKNQSFKRVRTWKIDGQKEPAVDDAEFRLFFPLELADYLRQHQFTILGLWDNKELKDSDLSDRRIYIAARAE